MTLLKMAVFTLGKGISSSVPESSTIFLTSVDMQATSGSTSKISPWEDFSKTLSPSGISKELSL